MDSVRIELDPFRASDGTALFRRRFRPAAAPIGDLLLGHGIGEDSSRYIQAARAFAEAGWQTVTWDLRGHGRSDGALLFGLSSFRQSFLIQAILIDKSNER